MMFKVMATATGRPSGTKATIKAKTTIMIPEASMKPAC
jgi:hypothetical protein